MLRCTRQHGNPISCGGPAPPPPRRMRLSLQRPAASNSPPASNRSRHAAASLGCFFLCINTWIFCAASSAGKSANTSKPPFRRSTSFRTDQKPGTTLCQPQRVARIGSLPLVWTTGRPTAKGGKGLCRVKKATPSAFTRGMPKYEPFNCFEGDSGCGRFMDLSQR